jgi:UDP-N-acetylglucosamine--N-acetylmuramyl-(pentapeptide) pyrophosphoryl-undecaprenol N-acetylglucosamine transferase
MANPPNSEGRLVLLAAGGSGGHLFPAEALALELQSRGVDVELVTDNRVVHFKFPANAVHLVRSATVRGRDPVSLARAALLLSFGTAQALRLIRRLRPAAVVGFGGYPTVPPLYAAALRRVRTVLHEQNAVMGRANRLLAPRVTAIATGFHTLARLDPRYESKIRFTGNPLRPQVIAAAARDYEPPAKDGPLRLLVFGGSQGAHVMAEVVPAAIERLPANLRARLSLVQQVRSEDIEAVQAAYGRLGVSVEIAAFFDDLPQRMAAAHLVIARSGASTVSELAAIGCPAVLVPLPNALDQDQFVNAGVLAAAGGAMRIGQREFTAERLALQIVALASEPVRLARMAKGAKSAGTMDAAERLADLVMQVASL